MVAGRVDAETQAWLDQLSAEDLALARDYTTGDHWLILVGLVASALVTWVILRSGLLESVFRKLENRGWALRTLLVMAVWLTIDTLLTLPLTIYQSWWRETAYGRTSQPLGDFLGQAGISFVLNLVLVSLLLLGLYALIRKAGRWWWAWSGALVAGAAAFVLLLSPILIEPLFNDYRPIPPGEVHDGVMALAAEADVPEERVFMYDGSRQSNNFSANVSGVGSSARIAISDVALDRAELDEVLVVTGHEIGHYTSGHLWIFLGVISLLAMAIFWLTARLYPPVARLFGSKAELADPRGVPIFVFLTGLLLTLAMPIINTMVRMSETHADRYAMEHVGLPDAMASALIKTAEFRYPLAGPVEEALFYDHPSVANRVRAAMEWKVRHLPRSSETE